MSCATTTPTLPFHAASGTKIYRLTRIKYGPSISSHTRLELRAGRYYCCTAPQKSSDSGGRMIIKIIIITRTTHSEVHGAHVSSTPSPSNLEVPTVSILVPRGIEGEIATSPYLHPLQPPPHSTIACGMKAATIPRRFRQKYIPNASK